MFYAVAAADDDDQLSLLLSVCIACMHGWIEWERVCNKAYLGMENFVLNEMKLGECLNGVYDDG